MVAYLYIVQFFLTFPARVPIGNRFRRPAQCSSLQAMEQDVVRRIAYLAVGVAVVVALIFIITNMISATDQRNIPPPPSANQETDQ